MPMPARFGLGGDELGQLPGLDGVRRDPGDLRLLERIDQGFAKINATGAAAKVAAKPLSDVASSAASAGLNVWFKWVVAGATGKIGLLRGAASMLSKAFLPLAAVDFLLNFKQYGTAIGEFAARMLRAKIQTDDFAARV